MDCLTMLNLIILWNISFESMCNYKKIQVYTFKTNIASDIINYTIHVNAFIFKQHPLTLYL